MVRSGELAKYPLAIVSDFLRTHLDPDNVLGFDIGCSFSATVQSSRLVGPVATEQKLHILVNAFHGWAHNRTCQLEYHPLYTLGFGLEDLEGMERIFSLSNLVAPLVRSASRFHWLQAYDLHFQQWDEDKYSNLSIFLLNNYRQALRTILEYSPEVDRELRRLDLDRDTVQGWIQEELAYLRSKTSGESTERTLECGYLKELKEMSAADQAYQTTRSDLRITNWTPGVSYGADAAATNKAERKRELAMSRFLLHQQAVFDFEFRLKVAKRWEPTDPKYKEIEEYIKKRDFYQALNKLQGLVVQRLFELQKANVPGMSYNVRKNVWAHLNTRSQAIRTALNNYNALAVKMNPPAEILDIQKIMELTFVAEFDLLRQSYGDTEILQKPWMSPANRLVCNRLFKVVRAEEELDRLNLEMRRLRTWLLADAKAYEDAINGLSTRHETIFAAEVREQYNRRQAINNNHHSILNTIEGLTGFTG
ncbi:uncharacterized protein STEHIDRAFT_85498, partial [Stereum hirsutum FP-91666 SS1]|uniref:uncharacterized protein n=1 Tax=Stereum hirsutum (strain FP-91666) TaxID=721885 RepID=UPI0004449796